MAAILIVLATSPRCTEDAKGRGSLSPLFVLLLQEGLCDSQLIFRHYGRKNDDSGCIFWLDPYVRNGWRRQNYHHRN